MAQNIPYKLPSVTHTRNKKMRKVGFELEFTGLDLNQTTAVVEQVFSGKRTSASPAACVVSVQELGDFAIELDWHFLKKIALQQNRVKSGDWLDLLSQAAALLVPMEVVCPPIAVSDLDRLDPLVRELRRAGARGTEDSMIAAYGVHINTEVPHLDASCLAGYLRAFSLLQWWLVDAHQVDFARRISPFVDLYPEAYLKQLFSRTAPGQNQISDDYFQHNASRNRALDLLPLFAHMNADQVRRAVSDTKIKARPAFHYRLPNCQIDKPDWCLALPWNTWWVVEELAQRPDDLQDLGQQFLAMHRPLLGVSRNDWTALMSRWLQDHALA
ncbi:MAG: amidoligase family protein [Desulfotignum sp.]